MKMNSNDYYKIITNIYRKYNPLKVNDVSNLLSKYKGNEELLLQGILAKYNISNADIISISTISLEIADKKIELQKNLERIKNLYDTKAINEDSYLKQKEDIEKKIEILSFNDTALLKKRQYEEFFPTEFEKKKKNLVIGILTGTTIFLISFLSYLMYDGQTKSFNFNKISSIFSAESRDKEEIKSQLKSAYLNVSNGICSPDEFTGLDSKELPFYNIDVFDEKTFNIMLVLALAQTFGKVQIVPSNIEISDFNSKNNTANLRYDISIYVTFNGNTTKFSDDTTKYRINMITKKIDGQWKFDVEKFFACDKKKITTNEETKTNSNSVNNSSNETANILFKVDENFFNDFEEKHSHNYTQIEDEREINQLLTAELKNKLGNAWEQYEYYDIKQIEFKDFILHFFIYTYHGVEISVVVQMNVCDKAGNIIDTKELAEDSYDQDVDNDYTISNCTIYDNGQILIKKESQNNSYSKKKIETKKYFINSTGKVVSQ